MTDCMASKTHAASVRTDGDTPPTVVMGNLTNIATEYEAGLEKPRFLRIFFLGGGRYNRF